MSAFSYEIQKDGIAVLTFDLPGEKVNKLATPVMNELDSLLDRLAADRNIKALVIRSGKEGNFIAGADIAEIRNITDPALGRELARKGQAVFLKLEKLPFPTVAAIHGACLGGGLELALACSHRVFSSDPKTALGAPEVRIGIMPGFGGTQRLPRLVGIANSLDMVLTGKNVYSRKAKKIGLADEVTFKETLLDIAIRTAKKAVGRPRPNKVRARRPLLIRLLESNPLTRLIIYASAKKNVIEETRGNYPAPLKALGSIRYGLSHRREAGYEREATLLGELIATETSKNLISLFYLNEALKKDPLPSPGRVARAGVLGAGVMGGGIAQLFAERGITVRMKDVVTKGVGAGLKAAADIFRKREKKGILSAIEARDGFDRVTGATDYSGVLHADLVVEAVVENMEVKKAVLREAEQVMREDAIYASNTSSLSITEMATASKRPERVVGMHFFNPVEKMPLVEIVRGERTSDETVSAIATLSRRLGKLPVTVNDGPGFLVNRILMPYLGEAVRMLEEGGAVLDIDRPLLRFGMPMGAFILLDEIGIDVAHKVADILHLGLGERVKPSPLLGALYKEGYLGKKNGRGFYLYKGRKRGGPDPFIQSKIAATNAGAKISDEEIIERAVLLMVKEAALCLEEKIVDTPEHLDAALIFGIGFPPFRGGLLRYADKLGIKNVVEKLEGYAKKYGERFSSPESLVEMTKSGKGFYG